MAQEGGDDSVVTQIPQVPIPESSLLTVVNSKLRFSFLLDHQQRQNDVNNHVQI